MSSNPFLNRVTHGRRFTAQILLQRLQLRSQGINIIKRRLGRVWIVEIIPHFFR